VEHPLENLTSCPSCGGTSFDPVLTCLDHTYSKQAFHIVACTVCGLNFTNPRPDENSIGIYYQSPEYVSHTDTSSGLLFRSYQAVKSFTLVQKRKFVASLATGRHLFDYGAGSGDFANEMQRDNWTVTAFEPDANARQRIAFKNTDIRLVSSLSEIPDGSQSVITLWHVLEHVHRLRDTLNHFHRILSPNGKLIVAVPNHTSYDAAFYGKDWAAYDVPRHLYHFDVQSMSRLMSSAGFRLTEKRPMWFDAFYVSLLSERNKAQGNRIKWMVGWVRALLVGSISNFQALRDAAKCSSITYIFERSH